MASVCMEDEVSGGGGIEQEALGGTEEYSENARVSWLPLPAELSPFFFPDGLCLCLVSYQGHWSVVSTKGYLT